MNPANYLYLAALLFTIGAVGVVVRRNAIVVFMCIELMLNAANLAFVTFARINGNLDGQVVAFFTMVIAACEVVIGLAIIVTIYRSRRSASIDDASLLFLMGKKVHVVMGSRMNFKVVTEDDLLLLEKLI